MAKLPMYILLSVCMGIGGFLPVLFGQSAFGGWSIIGTIAGGVVGVILYWKARQAGYLE